MEMEDSSKHDSHFIKFYLVVFGLQSMFFLLIFYYFVGFILKFDFD
jgi:hypothetical protein